MGAVGGHGAGWDGEGVVAAGHREKLGYCGGLFFLELHVSRVLSSLFYPSPPPPSCALGIAC
jgi:hypothetical protein